MTTPSINVSLTESEVEACWSAVSDLPSSGISQKIGRLLDNAALSRLYNAGDDVQGYGLPQFAIDLTHDELAALLEGLERAVGRYELGMARPMPAAMEVATLPVQRYHDLHRKLHRAAAVAR